MSNNINTILQKIHNICLDYLNKYPKEWNEQQLIIINQLIASQSIEEVIRTLNEKNKKLLSEPFINFNEFSLLNLIIFLSFPVSIPVLSLWSWLQRGNANLLKEHGSELIEEILKQCKQAQKINNNQNPRTDMNPEKLLSTFNSTKKISAFKKEDAHEKTTSTLPSSRDDESSLNDRYMSELNQATSKLFSWMIESMPVLQNKMRADFLGSPLIMTARVRNSFNPDHFRIDLRCKFASTRFNPVITSISILKNLLSDDFKNINKYQLLREIPKPEDGKLIIRSINYFQPFFHNLTIDYFESFVHKSTFEDFYLYAKKLSDKFLKGIYEREEAWEKAFEAARTPFQKTLVLENYINLLESSSLDDYQDYISTKTPYSPPHEKEEYDRKRAISLAKITKCLNKLPHNFHLMNYTAVDLYQRLTSIINLIENNDWLRAWAELSFISEISAFIKYALPEFEAMYYQLKGVFHILNNDGYILFAGSGQNYVTDEDILEDDSNRLYLYLQDDIIWCVGHKNNKVERFIIPLNELGKQAEKIYEKVKIGSAYIRPEQELALFRVITKHGFYPLNENSRNVTSIKKARSIFERSFNILLNCQGQHSKYLYENTIYPLEELLDKGKEAVKKTSVKTRDEVCDEDEIELRRQLFLQKRRIDPIYSEEEWERFLSEENINQNENLLSCK